MTARYKRAQIDVGTSRACAGRRSTATGVILNVAPGHQLALGAQPGRCTFNRERHGHQDPWRGFTFRCRMGRLDVLVNNAGIQHVAPIQDFPSEKWDAILAINLSSAFHTTRIALPSMLRNKWGRVINIASAHGLVASPFKSAYVAAKHGIVGLTKVIALETAEQGITCNAICPGYVYTPLVEAQIES